MRRSDALKKFKKLLAEVRPRLVAAGADAAKLDRLDPEKAPPDALVEGRHARLLALKEGPEYRAFVAIWTERPPEWWANMELLDQTDGVEFKVLRKTSTGLRRAFKATLKALKDDAEEARLHDQFPDPPAPPGEEVPVEPEEVNAEARA